MVGSRTAGLRPARSGSRTTGVLTVAHRGASARAPENTLAAVHAAVEDGADVVEVDVRRTRDGALVLMHDATAERVTDVALVCPRLASTPVEELTLAQVSRLSVPGAGGSPHEPVPTLGAVLDVAAAAGIGVLVELKASARHGLPLAEVEAVLAGRDGPVTVQSFDLAGLRRLRDRLPTVPLAALTHTRRPRLGDLSRWADQVHVHHRRVDRRLVDEAHGWGMTCLAWTVNEPARMRHLVDLGVDGVITDHPARLRSLLRPVPPLSG